MSIAKKTSTIAGRHPRQDDRSAGARLRPSRYPEAPTRRKIASEQALPTARLHRVDDVGDDEHERGGDQHAGVVERDRRPKKVGNPRLAEHRVRPPDA